MKKRIFSFFLCIVMLLSVMPLPTLAADLPTVQVNVIYDSYSHTADVTWAKSEGAKGYCVKLYVQMSDGRYNELSQTSWNSDSFFEGKYAVSFKNSDFFLTNPYSVKADGTVTYSVDYYKVVLLAVKENFGKEYEIGQCIFSTGIPKLATPQNVKMDKYGKVTWNPVPNATGYNIYVDGFDSPKTVSGNATSYTFDLVEDFNLSGQWGRTYTAAVTASDKTGNYRESNRGESESVAVTGNYWTVTYDANGGIGLMLPENFWCNNPQNDQEAIGFTYPACLFKAPDGMVFDHWECTQGELKWDAQPYDFYTLTGDLQLKAVWKRYSGSLYDVYDVVLPSLQEAYYRETSVVSNKGREIISVSTFDQLKVALETPGYFRIVLLNDIDFEYKGKNNRETLITVAEGPKELFLAGKDIYVKNTAYSFNHDVDRSIHSTLLSVPENAFLVILGYYDYDNSKAGGSIIYDGYLSDYGDYQNELNVFDVAGKLLVSGGEIGTSARSNLSPDFKWHLIRKALMGSAITVEPTGYVEIAGGDFTGSGPAKLGYITYNSAAVKNIGGRLAISGGNFYGRNNAYSVYTDEDGLTVIHEGCFYSKDSWSTYAVGYDSGKHYNIGNDVPNPPSMPMGSLAEAASLLSKSDNKTVIGGRDGHEITVTMPNAVESDVGYIVAPGREPTVQIEYTPVYRPFETEDFNSSTSDCSYLIAYFSVYDITTHEKIGENDVFLFDWARSTSVHSLIEDKGYSILGYNEPLYHYYQGGVYNCSLPTAYRDNKVSNNLVPGHYYQVTVYIAERTSLGWNETQSDGYPDFRVESAKSSFYFYYSFDFDKSKLKSDIVNHEDGGAIAFYPTKELQKSLDATDNVTTRSQYIVQLMQDNVSFRTIVTEEGRSLTYEQLGIPDVGDKAIIRSGLIVTDKATGESQTYYGLKQNIYHMPEITANVAVDSDGNAFAPEGQYVTLYADRDNALGNNITDDWGWYEWIDGEWVKPYTFIDSSTYQVMAEGEKHKLIFASPDFLLNGEKAGNVSPNTITVQKFKEAKLPTTFTGSKTASLLKPSTLTAGVSGTNWPEGALITYKFTVTGPKGATFRFGGEITAKTTDRTYAVTTGQFFPHGTDAPASPSFEDFAASVVPGTYTFKVEITATKNGITYTGDTKEIAVNYSVESGGADIVSGGKTLTDIPSTPNIREDQIILACEDGSATLKAVRRRDNSDASMSYKWQVADPYTVAISATEGTSIIVRGLRPGTTKITLTAVEGGGNVSYTTECYVTVPVSHFIIDSALPYIGATMADTVSIASKDYYRTRYIGWEVNETFFENSVLKADGFIFAHDVKYSPEVILECTRASLDYHDPQYTDFPYHWDETYGKVYDTQNIVFTYNGKEVQAKNVADAAYYNDSLCQLTLNPCRYPAIENEEDEYIDRMYIDINTPAVGTELNEWQSLPEELIDVGTPGVTVRGTVQEQLPDGTFTADTTLWAAGTGKISGGKVYRVSGYIYAGKVVDDGIDGYTWIRKNCKVYVNGQLVTLTAADDMAPVWMTESMSPDADYNDFLGFYCYFALPEPVSNILVNFPVPVQDMTLVDVCDVEIEEPVKGVRLNSFDITYENGGVTEKMQPSDTFVAGTEYTFSITLVLDENAVPGLSFSPDVSGSINHWGGTDTIVNDDGSVTLSITLSVQDGYYIWLGETRVTNENRHDILGDGSASYDPAKNKLKLNNAQIKVGKIDYLGNKEVGLYVRSSTGTGTTIELNGENTITLFADQSGYSAIETYGNVTFVGDGSLTAVSDNPNESNFAVGLRVDFGFLKFEGNTILKLHDAAFGAQGGTNSRVTVNGGMIEFDAKVRAASFGNLILGEGVKMYVGASIDELTMTSNQTDLKNNLCARIGKAYDLYVGGVLVDSGNCDDVLRDGKVSYDPVTDTLTLNGATVEAAILPASVTGLNRDTYFGVWSGSSLNLCLNNGRILATDVTSYAARAAAVNVNGDLKITGTGGEIKGATREGPVEIYYYPSYITRCSCGINADGFVTVDVENSLYVSGEDKGINYVDDEKTLRLVRGALTVMATDIDMTAFNCDIDLSEYGPCTVEYCPEWESVQTLGNAPDFVTALDVGYAYYISISPVTYNLWVTGKQVTSQNMTDILGDGTAYYDPETNTLTLDHFNGEKTNVKNGVYYPLTGTGVGTAAVINSHYGDLNVELIGDNQLLPATDEWSDICGIWCGGDLTIGGSGSLTVEIIEIVQNAYAIRAAGSITVNDASLIFYVSEPGTDGESIGIYQGGYPGGFFADDADILSYGSTYGIYIYGHDTEISDSECTFKGGVSGIYVDDDVFTINSGSNVIASSSTGDAVNCNDLYLEDESTFTAYTTAENRSAINGTIYPANYTNGYQVLVGSDLEHYGKWDRTGNYFGNDRFVSVRPAADMVNVYWYLDVNDTYPEGSIEFAKGETYAGPTAPSKTGYAFGGWFTDRALTQKYDSSAPLMQDVYLYPMWLEGANIRGIVTSFLSETDDVIVQLVEEGATEVAYKAIVTGNSASYSITGVAAGTYTMSVSKANHVMREYTVMVGSENVTQDVKIHLRGDINGDGKVNTSDVGKVNALAKRTSMLAGYELACADVNGDGRVNTSDVGKLNAHAKKTSLLW